MENERNHYIFADVKYHVRKGMREKFLSEMIEYQIPQLSRKESGNRKYEVYLSVDSEDDVILAEIWENKSAQKEHTTTKHYEILTELKKKYIETVEISNYVISE